MPKRTFSLAATLGAVLVIGGTFTAEVSAIGGHGPRTGTTSSSALPPPPKETPGDTTGSGDDGKVPDNSQSYPEPSTLLLGLLGIGCGSMVHIRRRKMRLAVA